MINNLRTKIVFTIKSTSKLAMLLSCALSLYCCSFTNKGYLQEIINKNTYNYHDSPYPKDALEVTTPTLLKVEGHIPDWLVGKLFRNSPGKFTIGDQHLHHWFDGFAFVSAFEFKKGQLYYQGAFLHSDQYLASMESGELKLSGYAQDTGGENEFYHVSRDGQKTKTANANINIEKVGEHLIALGETPLPIEIDPVSLKTIGIFDYEDKLNKAKMWESAHMKRDPETGVLYNFYTHYKFNSQYVIYKIEPNQTAWQKLVEYSISEPSYMHDFSITKNYIILTAYPLVVNPLDLVNIFATKPKYSFIGAHRWNPEKGTTIYVFDKKSGNLVTNIKTEAKFAFHHINCYEENGQIHLYLNAFKDAKMALAAGDPKELGSVLQLQKITINLEDSTAKTAILSNEKYELPRIKEDLVGRENQYFYAIWYSMPAAKNTLGLVKYDLKTNQVKSWYQEGLVPGEPLFIAHPKAKSEDEGVVVTVVYDEHAKESFLILLDALTMKELARARTPHALPLGLHARFFGS